MIKATFSQSRNDMYWSIYDLEDKRITWVGYDDEYWWSNIAENDKWRTRVGLHTGKTYVLDTTNDTVMVSP